MGKWEMDKWDLHSEDFDSGFVYTLKDSEGIIIEITDETDILLTRQSATELIKSLQKALDYEY